MSAPSNTERPGPGAAGGGSGDEVPVGGELLDEGSTPTTGEGPAPTTGDGAGASQTGRAEPVTAALEFLGEAEGDVLERPALHVARHPAQHRRPLRTALFGTLGVLLLVSGGVLLVPRPNSTPLQLVDVAAAAGSARTRLGFAPAVPVGPKGWTVTTAQVRNGTDGILTWHVGMMTGQGNYAGFEQAEHSTFTWENALDSGGKHIGTVDVDGVVWDHLEKAERGTTTLILRRYGKVTLVTAHGGGIPDAMTLIRGLPPDALT